MVVSLFPLLPFSFFCFLFHGNVERVRYNINKQINDSKSKESTKSEKKKKKTVISLQFWEVLSKNFLYLVNVGMMT